MQRYCFEPTAEIITLYIQGEPSNSTDLIFFVTNELKSNFISSPITIFRRTFEATTHRSFLYYFYASLQGHLRHILYINLYRLKKLLESLHSKTISTRVEGPSNRNHCIRDEENISIQILRRYREEETSRSSNAHSLSNKGVEHSNGPFFTNARYTCTHFGNCLLRDTYTLTLLFSEFIGTSNSIVKASSFHSVKTKSFRIFSTSLLAKKQFQPCHAPSESRTQLSLATFLSLLRRPRDVPFPADHPVHASLFRTGECTIYALLPPEKGSRAE